MRRLAGEGSDSHDVESFRSIVAFDMAHCKRPLSCGQLATATQYNGNDDALITAFAHLPTEDREQWEWFLSCFAAAFPKLCGKTASGPPPDGLVALADQDKVCNDVIYVMKCTQCMQYNPCNILNKF